MHLLIFASDEYLFQPNKNSDLCNEFPTGQIQKMKVVVVDTSRTITVNTFGCLRFTHKSRRISKRINSTSGSKGPNMCSNDFLIALVRYITPQDCIINSTLDGYHSTNETRKNVTCSHDVTQEPEGTD